MDVARILRSRNYKGYFIFVTVMEELVFDSFEVQAFDYFVKPVNHERFHKTMERLLSVMQNSSETNLFIQKEEMNGVLFPLMTLCIVKLSTGKFICI